MNYIYFIYRLLYSILLINELMRTKSEHPLNILECHLQIFLYTLEHWVTVATVPMRDLGQLLDRLSCGARKLGLVLGVFREM